MKSILVLCVLLLVIKVILAQNEQVVRINDGRYRPPPPNDGRYRPVSDGKYRPGNDGRYIPGDDGKYKHIEGAQGPNGPPPVPPPRPPPRPTGQRTTIAPKTTTTTTTTKTTTTTTLRPTTPTTQRITTITPLRPSLKPGRGNIEGGQGWKILELKHKHSKTDGYNYLYETENGILAEESGRVQNLAENSEGLRSTGFYEYTGDDGLLYRVDYIADDRGFIPQGDHLPETPAHVKRLLAYLAEKGKL